MSSRLELREALVSLDEHRDVIKDTHGNLSCRDGLDMHIKPSGVKYADIDVTQLCSFRIETGDRNGHVNKKPSVDTPHHLAIYRNYPHVNAICHTHSPYATAYAWADRDIFCGGTEHADFFGTAIRCLPYSDLNTWGIGVSLLNKGEVAVLLGKHGVLTFGSTPAEAVKLAVAVENVAMKLLLASYLNGGLVPTLSPDEAMKWHERYNGGGYGQ